MRNQKIHFDVKLSVKMSLQTETSRDSVKIISFHEKNQYAKFLNIIFY